jgi:hypothetical protein
MYGANSLGWKIALSLDIQETAFRSSLLAHYNRYACLLPALRQKSVALKPPMWYHAPAQVGLLIFGFS